MGGHPAGDRESQCECGGVNSAKRLEVPNEVNTQEREVFWDMLCTLPGLDPKQDVEKLMGTIKLPEFLFRYRPVTLSSLEALRTNRLYFSSVNDYDDPFDTFLHIDVERIRQVFVSALQTHERTEEVAKGVKSILGEMLPKEQQEFFTVNNVKEMPSSNELVENSLNFVLALRDEVKKDTWSICFSENDVNEVLWLKYADQHKGFVQIYDLRNDDNYSCGKQEKCQNCGIKNFGTPLYPIYYSEKPYDATNFAKIIMLKKT